jgi:hypothetical protein
MKLAIKPWMIISLLLPAVPVSASSLFKPVEVSDAELASLRGRYVLPEGIVHFGVSMATQWRNNSGATIGAEVNLSVNSLAQANLTVTPLYESGNGNLPAYGSGQVIGGQGLNQVQGISQSVRTAGDYNNGENYVDVHFIRSSGQTFSTEGQSWGGNQQFSNEAGAVTVSSVNGGLKMNLVAGQNQGQASQSIGHGGIAQQTNIHGQMNQVRNLTSLTVALQQNPARGQRVNCNLSDLAIMRRAGY